MGHETASTSRFRRELVLGGVHYGRWNGDEIERGSEVTEITDPETGPSTAGGRQTGSEVSLNRPWRYGRERATADALDRIRGRATGTLSIWELDDYGVPTSSEPIRTFPVALTSVTWPEGDADSSDAATLQIGLTVKP
ncbi:MAG: hypothetical protein M0P31_15415 [Solirubrobacteraceae bacterium]|nr:hypothetical protein [Solirubrobacteraceae bacterium]